MVLLLRSTGVSVVFAKLTSCTVVFCVQVYSAHTGPFGADHLLPLTVPLPFELVAPSFVSRAQLPSGDSHEEGMT